MSVADDQSEFFLDFRAGEEICQVGATPGVMVLVWIVDYAEQILDGYTNAREIVVLEDRGKHQGASPVCKYGAEAGTYGSAYPGRGFISYTVCSEAQRAIVLPDGVIGFAQFEGVAVPDEDLLGRDAGSLQSHGNGLSYLWTGGDLRATEGIDLYDHPVVRAEQDPPSIHTLLLSKLFQPQYDPFQNDLRVQKVMVLCQLWVTSENDLPPQGLDLTPRLKGVGVQGAVKAVPCPHREEASQGRLEEGSSRGCQSYTSSSA
jgi:hypothetical protein